MQCKTRSETLERGLTESAQQIRDLDQRAAAAEREKTDLTKKLESTQSSFNKLKEELHQLKEQRQHELDMGDHKQNNPEVINAGVAL